MLELIGEVDLSSVPQLSDALQRLVADERGKLVAIDLDGIVALDDMGLGIVLGAAGRARQQNGDLVVIATSLQLLRRLTVTGFDRAVDVVPSASAILERPDARPATVE